MCKSRNTISSIKPFWCAVLTLALIESQITAGHAQGLPLAPGGGGFITSGEAGPIGGSVVTSIDIPFSTASFTGDLISTVIGGDTSNPLGGYTFTYQYTIASGPDSSEGISLGGFSGFLTDVGYQAPTTGVAPVLVSRSMNGDNIEFNFVPQINPGETSALLVIQTAVQVFNVGTSTVLDNTGSPHVAILSPATVPEPTSVGCFLLGLGALIFTRRFRHNGRA
jgi:hypothetical protein